MEGETLVGVSLSGGCKVLLPEVVEKSVRLERYCKTCTFEKDDLTLDTPVKR